MRNEWCEGDDPAGSFSARGKTSLNRKFCDCCFFCLYCCKYCKNSSALHASWKRKAQLSLFSFEVCVIIQTIMNKERGECAHTLTHIHTKKTLQFILFRHFLSQLNDTVRAVPSALRLLGQVNAGVMKPLNRTLFIITRNHLAIVYLPTAAVDWHSWIKVSR